jgi:hypothetical protein
VQNSIIISQLKKPTIVITKEYVREYRDVNNAMNRKRLKRKNICQFGTFSIKNLGTLEKWEISGFSNFSRS